MNDLHHARLKADRIANGLDAITAIIRGWLNWHRRNRSDEHLATDGDTQIRALPVPYWPSHAQFEAWIKLFEEARAELVGMIDAKTRDAERYRYLRNRPEDTIGKGGVFAGMTPPTGQGGSILTEEDLDRAVDAAMVAEGAR